MFFNSDSPLSEEQRNALLENWFNFNEEIEREKLRPLDNKDGSEGTYESYRELMSKERLENYEKFIGARESDESKELKSKIQRELAQEKMEESTFLRKLREEKKIGARSGLPTTVWTHWLTGQTTSLFGSYTPGIERREEEPSQE